MNRLIFALALTGCSTSPSSNQAAPATAAKQEVTVVSTESNTQTQTGSGTATGQASDEGAPSKPQEATVAQATATDAGAAASTATQTATGNAAGAAAKLTDPACVDPDLAKVTTGVTFTLCDGTTGTGTYVAPILTALIPPNILSGVVINGVAGTVVQAPDLTALIAANLKQGVTINGIAGTVVPSPDLSALVAGNLKQGVTINGVSGTVVPKPTDCSGYNAVGCVTTSSFKVLDVSGLTPAVLKSGTAIAGVTGAYPSVSNPLPSSSGAALTAATLNARLADAGTTFEWYDSAGARYTSTGDAGLVPNKILTGTTVFGVAGSATVASAVTAGDVRVGTTLNGVTGSLKVNCRNNANTTNYPGTIAVDDYDFAHGFPTTLASGSTSDNSCGASNWTDLTSGGCSAADCLIKDSFTGLQWSKLYAATTHANAVSGCAALNYHGMTGWRLPSQKELMQAYVNGMDSTFVSNLSFTSYVWSSTTSASADSTLAVYVAPLQGNVAYTAKTDSEPYICVH